MVWAAIQTKKEENDMGIFLNLEIMPWKIRPEDWQAVYQESLKLVDAFPFLDVVKKSKNGRDYVCGTRSRSRTGIFGRECQGWRSVGDMETGSNTEDYILYSDIHEYLHGEGGPGSDEADILAVLMDASDWRQPENTTNVFGGKTQGERSHIPLLAIACMAEDRLPEGCAAVSGDINLAQCRRAVSWASQELGRPVSLPAVCRKEALHRRLSAIGLKGRELVEKMIELSLEGGWELGDFLQEKESDGWYAYFRDAFKGCDAGTMELERTVRRYLEMDGDFKNLCRMLVSDPEGRRLPLEDFLQVIVRIKLHVQEKETYDFTRTDRQNPEKDTVDDIGALMKRMFGGLFGLGNHNVNAYVPLEEIRESCREVCGESCDIDGTIGRALERQAGEDKKESVQSMLYDGRLEEMAGEREKEKEELAEKYDVVDKDGLGAWREGCRVEPKLEEWLLTLCRQLHGFSEKHFGEFQALGASGREDFFLRGYDHHVLLTDAVWDRIWEGIMDDAYIRRIHALWWVDTMTKSGSDICEMMYRYPEMYEYYWKETDGGAGPDGMQE